MPFPPRSTGIQLVAKSACLQREKIVKAQAYGVKCRSDDSPNRMGSRNRDRIRDPREEILLETNFDDDGVLTKAYNNHQPQPNRRRSTYRSEASLDRYSDVHGMGQSGGRAQCSQAFCVCFLVLLKCSSTSLMYTSFASFHSRTSYAPLLVTFTPTNLFLSLFISGNL